MSGTQLLCHPECSAAESKDLWHLFSLSGLGTPDSFFLWFHSERVSTTSGRVSMTSGLVITVAGLVQTTPGRVHTISERVQTTSGLVETNSGRVWIIRGVV